MAQLHSLLTAVHRPYAAVYADATARLAATGFVRALGGGVVAFAADDLYKIVLQLDDASEWVLTAITPTWVQISGAGSLANDSITNAKLANMAQATIKGRAAGAGTGDPTDLTGTQATAILDAVVGDSGSGGTKGLVPAPASGDAAAGKFLKADGTFAVPSGTTPGAHASTHQNGGGDEIDVSGLSGVLADPQVPITENVQDIVGALLADGGVDFTYDDAGNTITNKIKTVIAIAASDETTALTTGTAKVTFRMPHAMTLTDIRASLSTAQTSGSTFTVDVNEGGTTIISTKITIDNGEKTSTTAATPPVISDSALADDAEITIDIDQVGDGTAKGLKVYLIGTRS